MNIEKRWAMPTLHGEMHRLGSLCHQKGKLLAQNLKPKTGF